MDLVNKRKITLELSQFIKQQASISKTVILEAVHTEEWIRLN